MPWAIFNRPSVQLGALKASLAEQFPNLNVDTHHPYLSAAQAIGLQEYRLISENPWAGEALYSGLLFPENSEQAKKLFDRELPGGKNNPKRFDTLTNQLEQHLHSWLHDRDFSDCDLLGLSICFSQLIPSLYAAQKIKNLYPDLPILFGGSTCTPAVGTSLLQTFSDIDFILTGEGERPLAALVNHLDQQGPFPDKNILRRQQGDATSFSLQNDEKSDLDTLPTPDYDEYFQELATLPLSFIPELPIEFSRGCWWNKCSFCNLNLQWCGYRYKTNEKMLAEVKHLTNRHQCLDYFFTDNALPPQEAKHFFQQTAEHPGGFQFFAEIRIPKSTEECRIYTNGGLRSIQVGIEALSDPLLSRMKKGTTVIENIAAMKCSAAAGIQLDGNLILEFPGSTDQDVNHTLAALDAVFSYRPLKAASFFLGQGSPVHSQPSKFGIRATTHHPNNRLLFPTELLAGLDLLIKGYSGDRIEQRKRWQPVRKKIAAWEQFHRDRSSTDKPALSYREGESFLLLRQERPNQSTLHHRLKGLSRNIYLACEQPVSRKELLQRFKTIKEGQMITFLKDLKNKHLMYCDTTHCLALAIKEK